MPVYPKAPRARLAMPSDEDFTVLMPRTSAIPQSGARPKLDRIAPPEMPYAPRPAAGARLSPVPSSGARRMPEEPQMEMAAPPPTVSPDAYQSHERLRERVSERPARVSERPERVSGTARERVSERPTKAPMRAQAVVASPDETAPTRLRGWMRTRRGKVTVRALVLLALGGMLGVGTEAYVQRHALEPALETSAAIAKVPLSAPSPPPPTTLSAGSTSAASTNAASLSAASIANAQMQCSSSTPAAAPLAPIAANSPASTPDATPHKRHRVRHRHDAPPQEQEAVDTKSADTKIDPKNTAAAPVVAAAVIPQDDIAAAAEALSKAKEETTLP